MLGLDMEGAFPLPCPCRCGKLAYAVWDACVARHTMLSPQPSQYALSLPGGSRSIEESVNFGGARSGEMPDAASLVQNMNVVTIFKRGSTNRQAAGG